MFLFVIGKGHFIEPHYFIVKWPTPHSVAFSVFIFIYYIASWPSLKFDTSAFCTSCWVYNTLTAGTEVSCFSQNCYL